MKTAPTPTINPNTIVLTFLAIVTVIASLVCILTEKTA